MPFPPAASFQYHAVRDERSLMHLPCHIEQVPDIYTLADRSHQPGPTFMRLFLTKPEIDGQKKMSPAAIMIGNAIGG